MTPAMLPLMLASNDAVGESETAPLDRLRIQKGVFLLVKQGAEAWRDLYKFKAYDWGPYSADLTSDVQNLIATNQLLFDHYVRGPYGAYKISIVGERKLADIDLATKETDYVRKVRAYVTTQRFDQLLRGLYKAYPQYAINSRFKP